MDREFFSGLIIGALAMGTVWTICVLNDDPFKDNRLIQNEIVKHGCAEWVLKGDQAVWQWKHQPNEESVE